VDDSDDEDDDDEIGAELYRRLQELQSAKENPNSSLLSLLPESITQHFKNRVVDNYEIVRAGNYKKEFKSRCLTLESQYLQKRGLEVGLMI
jgi:hypothetical protein